MLTPQHFQQMEIRNYQLITEQIKLLSSAYWGVSNLKIDAISLPDGLFRIVEIDGVMPDGLVVSYGAEMKGVDPLEFDLTPFKAEFPKEGLTISICVQSRKAGFSPLLGDHPRFKSIEWEDVIDENVGGMPIKIPRLFPNLYLQVGELPESDAVGFPIAKIDFIDECFVLKNYTPPCFFISRGSPIWERCTQVVQKMREKVSFLVERWQNQVGTPLSHETESILKPMIMALPSFESMLLSNDVPPFHMYQRICQIVGYLYTLRLSQVPPVPPPYRHSDINSSFLPMLDLIDEYLKSIDNTFAVFPFIQKDRLYSLRLHKAYGEKDLFIGVKAPRGMGESHIEEWMQGAVIASDSAIETVQKKRITGAMRQLVRDQDLQEIMPSRGVVVFRISFDGEFVLPDQKLNIFNPGDTEERRPADIVLFVPKVPTGGNA